MPDPTGTPPEPEPRGLARLKAEGKSQPPMVVRNVDDVLRLGEIFVKSGMFKDSTAISQAAVKILYGVELGIGPMAAMTGITMVDGSLSIGANLCAARINASPDHRYRVEVNTATECTLAFTAREEGEWIERGRVTWTIEDAATAGLKGKNNWRSYPRAMLFARAMTEGARTYCAELFGGVPVYTEEELGGDGPPDGFDLSTPPPPPPAPSTPPAAPDPEHGDDAPLEGDVVDEGRDDPAPAPAEPEDSPAEAPQAPQDGPPAPPAGEDTPEAPEAPQAPAQGDEAAADAAWSAAPAEPTPAEEAAALEAAGQTTLTPRERDPEPAAPSLDPAHLATLTEPWTGTRDAGRAAARELGLKGRLMKYGGDELRLVELAERLALPGLWTLYDDDVFHALGGAVGLWCAEQERQAAAS